MAQPYAPYPGVQIPGVLDFNDSQQYKIYLKGCQSFMGEEKYDLSHEGLHTFMELIEQRGNAMGWNQDPNGLSWVPRNPEAANLAGEENDFFFHEYAQMDIERISQWELRAANDELRAGQDSNMLFMAIMASLTSEAISIITLEKDKYEYTSEAGHTLQLGLTCLKVIADHVSNETPGMASMLRAELTNLGDLLIKLDSDISAFNTQVKDKIRRLNKIGQKESPEDLLVSLFNAYEQAQDEDFAKYITTRRTEHEDERNEMHYMALMAIAHKKYILMKRRGTWNAPTKTQEKLMVLETKLSGVQSTIQGLKKKAANKKVKEDGEKKPGKGTDKPDWLKKNTAPHPSAAKSPKQHNGNNYHWCHSSTGGKCDGKWRIHKPSECQGKAFNPKRTQEGSTPPKKKAKMVLAQEAKAILENAGLSVEEALIEKEE